MTPPGTHLRFGEKAVVPFRMYDSFARVYYEAVLGVVVQPLRTAPGSQVIDRFDADDRALLDTLTAYAARVQITLESGDLPEVFHLRLDGTLSGGRAPNYSMIGGSLRDCSTMMEHRPPPEPNTTCTVDVSVPSEPIQEIHYRSPPYGPEIDSSDPGQGRFAQYYSLGDISWS